MASRLKVVITSRKSKEDRQYKGQKRQGTNNDIQNTTPKTKERAERTTLKTGGEVRSSGGGMVGGKQFLLNMWLLSLPWFKFKRGYGVVVMVCNAIFSNISVISRRSVLLVEETGVPAENHRLVASHWQTLSHIVVSPEKDSNSQC